MLAIAQLDQIAQEIDLPIHETIHKKLLERDSRLVRKFVTGDSKYKLHKLSVRAGIQIVSFSR